ncbi:NAD(P)/FAD-dependent oxidoreductase [Paraburkholderia sp. HD33-4]|uniref:NAD(P)/FAD-dependent oxidoreductase n=1 Tax=Paraburkholderia sp. HD33-4 TaxID=2883242 RepID=UPI001F1802B8|nr:NAD(P)/FAD-dependent oxidoreductase [Paraburkholderia sp. HD33-4]
MAIHRKTNTLETPHRIVIVGGGAAGLELATRLGNGVGKEGRAQVVLVDRNPAHFWKPLLHEVAAGQIDASSHQIEYAAHAKWNHYRFERGGLRSIDRERREIVIDETSGADGQPLLQRRSIGFDTLVLALGSVTNFFSVPGAEEYALTLETVDQAEAFRRRLLSSLLRAGHAQQSSSQSVKEPVCVTVIGAGATGVELSASLRSLAQMLHDYHLPSLDPARDVRIRLLEGAQRVLPALPERISARAHDVLSSLGVEVHTETRVRSVDAESVVVGEGHALRSDVTIWAAGVEGPPILKALGAFELNRLGQVSVDRMLRVDPESGIYAMGDCAACSARGDDALVPPRAQAAWQQAVYLHDALTRRLKHQSIPLFSYRDQGTLISFGQAGAAGALMSELLRGPVFIDGWFAASCYKHLYRRHIIGLTGIRRAVMYSASQWLRERVRPTVKLN